MSADESNEQPWERRPDESNRWYQRFSTYLALGAGRSVRAVYNAEKNNASSKPTPASWTEASHRFDWQSRAEQYDAWRREIVFSTGNAQDTERIKKLDALTERMYQRLMADIDQVPVNEKFLERFTQIVDLLAKHTGGYVPQRIEHTGKDGGKIEVEEEHKLKVIFYMPDIEDIEEPANVPEDQDGAV
jgi:hypothetical protein